MKKKGNNYIEYRCYEKDNPIEEAVRILDWLDSVEDTKIRQVVDELSDGGCLNDFGKEVKAYIDIMTGNIATNKGVGETNLNRYKKYLEWIESNNENTIGTETIKLYINKAFENNN